MGWIVLAVGLVFMVEGLLYALAPGAVEELLELLQSLPPETRRLMGLAAMATGFLLAWIGHLLI